MQNFGLIGFPLGHSFSNRFFSEKFKQEHIDAEYKLYELPDIEQFDSLIKSVCFSGLNVTIPYKERIIPFLDVLDPVSKVVGAVNVIAFERKKTECRIVGHNSDVVGFRNSLVPLLQKHHRKALVLGTGGASKAVLYVLNELGIDTQLVSRKKTDNAIAYSDMSPEMMESNTLIINTTPLGMAPNVDQKPEIPYMCLTARHLLFDLTYNPAKTAFLKAGEMYGCTIKNGYDMLVGQAVESWRIWQKTF